MWFDIWTNLSDILRKKICRKNSNYFNNNHCSFFPPEFRTKVKMTDFLTLIHHCPRSSKQVQKWSWRKRKRDWMGVFIAFRGQSWVRVPTHWQQLVWYGPPVRVSEGEPWLCFQLAQVWWRSREGRMRLNNRENINICPQALYYITLPLPHTLDAASL